MVKINNFKLNKIEMSGKRRRNQKIRCACSICGSVTVRDKCDCIYRCPHPHHSLNCRGNKPTRSLCPQCIESAPKGARVWDEELRKFVSADNVQSSVGGGEDEGDWDWDDSGAEAGQDDRVSFDLLNQLLDQEDLQEPKRQEADPQEADRQEADHQEAERLLDLFEQDD